MDVPSFQSRLWCLECRCFEVKPTFGFLSALYEGRTLSWWCGLLHLLCITCHFETRLYHIRLVNSDTETNHDDKEHSCQCPEELKMKVCTARIFKLDHCDVSIRRSRCKAAFDNPCTNQWSPNPFASGKCNWDRFEVRYEIDWNGTC